MSKVSKLFVFSYSLPFHTICIFDHNLRTHTPIKLKLNKHNVLFKAHLYTNFDWDLKF